MMRLEGFLKRIGSIRPLFKLRTLCARCKSHQILVQTPPCPVEFEPQTPSNSALAHSQAHLSMPLAQHGRSSIQPEPETLAVPCMQPAAHVGSSA